jgi:hypothetical protein
MNQEQKKTNDSNFEITWDNIKFENDYYSQTIEANTQVSLKNIFKELNLNLQEINGSGWSHKGSCPFPDHNDDSPSFFVNFNINKFNCFGCSKKGGPVQFLSYLENKSIKDVLEQISNNYTFYKIKNKNLPSINKSFLSDEHLDILLNFADLNFSYLKDNNFSDESFNFIFNLNHLSEFYIRNSLENDSSLEDLESRLDLISSNLE